MKKLLSALLAAAMLFSLAACGSTNTQADSAQVSSTPAEPPELSASRPESAGQPDSMPAAPEADSASVPAEEGPRVLVAYFSATGTTRGIAQHAANAMNADLYEIVPAKPYTDADLDYNTDCRANREMDDPDARPAISGSVENMADYDIVFIGYPIWWGEAPRIISTFVESYELAGKTIVTFSTSGGSGHNDSSIRSLVSSANWITGTRMSGSASQADVADWIGGLDLDIPLSE